MPPQKPRRGRTNHINPECLLIKLITMVTRNHRSPHLIFTHGNLCPNF
uniref:Uncharacterized protein n=1 Tax=Anguilla anguilla TaxID=7936 RepID=A0A0E9S9P6_ANGAN